MVARGGRVASPATIWTRSASSSAAMLRRSAVSASRSLSMKAAALAPRDRASRPSAPVPAKASSTGRPANGKPEAAKLPWLRMLKSASRARSLVGRTNSPGGATSRRPRWLPPTMRNPRGFASEEGIFHDKQQGEHNHRRARLGKPPGQQFDRGIADETEGNPVGDREGQRHGQRRHDGRGVFGDIIPVELGKAAGHQAGDKQQGRRGGIGRDRLGERREE